MKKIILNGEAHNSSLAPLLAVRDIGLLSKLGNPVICASEDSQLMGEESDIARQELQEFVENIEKITKVKLKLAEKNEPLLNKIISDEEELRFTQPEMKLLRELINESGFEDGFQPMDLVGSIAGLDEMSAGYGGYDRLASYLQFATLTQNFEKISIENEEAVKEIHQLKEAHVIGNISEEEKDRLSKLISSSEVEDRRIATMAEILFNKAVATEGDAIIYVYPLGNFHVAAIAEKLETLSKNSGENIEIHANRLWDSQESRKFVIDAAERYLNEGGKVKDFFLSEPNRGGYDKMFAETFPDMTPATSCEGVSGDTFSKEKASNFKY